MGKRKICFLCGKPAVKEGYCEEHWGKKNPLIKLPEKIEVVQCPKCGLVKIKNKWVEPDLEKIVKKFAKVLGEVDEWLVGVVNGETKVHVSGWIRGFRKEEFHFIKIKFVKRVCPICTRLLGGYYEAKIQLRGEVTGPILAWIREETLRIGKRDKKAFYRHKLLKEGIDLYYGSKSAARKIANGLKKRFAAETKESFKVWGRKDGKEIKRLIISVRFKGKYKPVLQTFSDIMAFKRREPLTPEEEIARIRMPEKDEIFGVVLEMLGAGKLRVECDDGLIRICRIPGKIRKRIWVRIGDLILVKPWTVQPKERADVIWKYTKTQANWLKKKGYLKKVQWG